jgi:hypothetical protein
VRLVHHGLPPEAVEDHERGWAYFLGSCVTPLCEAALECPAGRAVAAGFLSACW